MSQFAISLGLLDSDNFMFKCVAVLVKNITAGSCPSFVFLQLALFVSFTFEKNLLAFNFKRLVFIVIFP